MTGMRTLQRMLSLFGFTTFFFLTAVHGAYAGTVAVLEPHGLIALQERNLIVFAVFLMLLVVIPVFILMAVIAWRYRAGNTSAAYTPDHDHDLVAELTWWAIPAVIIFALAVVTWKSSHDLDPYRPLRTAAKPLTIQVVALDWKWLFIYPEQGIATVNEAYLPENTPIDFEITADAPMNSLWIPQLGGQIYAMPGMVTRLHLMADRTGDYSGVSANFSGAGFSGMKFAAHAVTGADFEYWVQSAKQNPSALTLEEYDTLSKPSTNDPVRSYGTVDPSLYNAIVDKFLMPAAGSHESAMPMTH